MRYQAISGVPLLFCATDDQGNNPDMARLYLLPPGSAIPNGPLTLAESWSNPGAYLFLEQPLPTASAAAFAAAAQAFLASPHMANSRLVWINTPQLPAPLTGANIPIYQPNSAGPFLTAAPSNFRFQNITLVIPANTNVAPNLTDFTIVLTSANNSIYLEAMFGLAQVPLPNTAVTIPLYGPQTGTLAGCLQFSGTFSLQNLTDLDAGLRYYYASPLGLGSPTQQSQSFYLSSLRYPIFAAPVTLYGNLDPLAPIGPQLPVRNFLAFNGADAGQPNAGPAPAVATNFSSTLGDQISLVPQPGSMLVFAVNREASAPNAQDPYYLVPSGSFQISLSRQGTVDLMCGLSGVEYVEITNGSGNTNTLTFYPWQAAFAPGFYPGEQPGYTTVSPLPNAMPTTSFVWLTSSNQLDYYAQPDQSVLYNYPDTSNPISALSMVPVLANTLPGTPPAGALFPLMPYAGLSGQDLGVFSQMETQAVSPARRLALAATGNPTPPVNPPALTSIYSATPQGLLVQYTEGSTNWPTVILGQTQANQKAQPFQFTAVQGPLLTALETNQLFLVATNGDYFKQFLSTVNAQITLGAANDPWNFNIDPSVWSQQNTIFILKFSDLSINDLAGETSAWAYPGTFNQSPSQVSAAIKKIIGSVNPTDPDFAQFLYAVNTPTWNGVLILNAVAPVNELPPQISGLQAGINKKLFYAHHVGINASKIIVPTQPPPPQKVNLQIDNSSVFGLINYIGGPLGPSDNYQFTVRTMKVLFLNSAVAGFSSIIDIQLNSFFSETAVLDQQDANNVVEMFGVYQQHVVNGIPQDSYSFQTANGLSADFNMPGSKVLNAVEISQGQFVTLTAQSSANLTQSQFAFWGLIDFQALDGFDCFSFGRQNPKDAPQGLAFSKLAINMSFNPNDTSGPNGGPVITFAFDASQIAFDMASSVARTGSFFAHFPLTVAGFTQAASGVTAASLGFMSVQTPLNQSLLSFPWFSLNLNLNLGSTGALAAQAGFVATLTIGWAPSTGPDYLVFTGLKLPGSNGAQRQITIEGIFDITFKTLQIISIPATNTFILVLFGIGFKFLSFQFPPSGQVNFVLFGNPNQSTDNTNLGWYAAYAKTGSAGGDGGGKDNGNAKALLKGAELRRLSAGIHSCVAEGGVR